MDTHKPSFVKSVFFTRHTQVYIAGQVTYTQPQVSELSKPSVATGKLPATGNFLRDATEYALAFKVEANASGTPVPVVTKEGIAGKREWKARKGLSWRD